MKIKLRNDGPKYPNYDLWQFEVIPQIAFFCGQGTTCFCIGWIFWRLEFWFGNTEDLV